MCVVRCAVFVLLAALVSVASAQTAPTDFSGIWKMNLTKSTFSKDAPTEAEILTVKNLGGRLEFDSQSGGREDIHVYEIERKPRAQPELLNGSMSAKVYWKAGALIIEERPTGKSSRLSFANSPMEATTSRWTLSQDGKILTDSVESAEGKSVLVYERQ